MTAPVARNGQMPWQVKYITAPKGCQRFLRTPKKPFP